MERAELIHRESSCAGPLGMTRPNRNDWSHGGLRSSTVQSFDRGPLNVKFILYVDGPKAPCLLGKGLN